MTRGRALLLCQLFYPEMVSTGMHMTELACALTKLGWKVDVVCAQPSVDSEALNEPTPSVMEFSGIGIRRVTPFGAHRGSLFRRLVFALSFVVQSGILAFRRCGEYDALIVTTNPPFLGVVGRVISVLRRKPYLLIVYDVYPDTVLRLGLLKSRSLPAWLWDRISRTILRGAAKIVVIGRDMEKVIAAKIGPKYRRRICLIPNWSDASVVRPTPREANAFRKEHCPGNLFVVQYSGTMARIHNLECLIEAAELVQNEPILFQFIGGGAKKEKLRTMAVERGLRNVQFFPFQRIERLAEVLTAADLAVVCLAHEFTGLSVPSKAYGIMAAGVPILGLLHSESEIGLTIQESGCGVVIAHARSNEIADTLRRFSSDRTKSQQMGENGRRAFRSRYTLEHAADLYGEALSSMLDQPARRENSSVGLDERGLSDSRT